MDSKGTPGFCGLSESQAAEIIRKDGFNELPSQGGHSNLAIFLRVLSEPMLLLLVAGGAIYFFMGDAQDALMLLTFVFAVIGITFFQERKTEKTLEALRNLSSPRALVIRDGKQIRIPGREVVRGDLIIIREGDRIPADAVIISCENLSVDESLLTGESTAVRKSEWDGVQKEQRPGGDDLPFVYSGSLVVSGHGRALVRLTGIETEMGKIGKHLGTIKSEETLLHKETTMIVRVMAIIGALLCGLVVLFYVMFKGDLIQGLLEGLTLCMALLPEEFPVVLLIFMTLGAWRISKRKVLTRHAAAIETLGAATVLCTDKTGTLTMNKMELTTLYTNGSYFEINDSVPNWFPEKFLYLLKYGVLAGQKDPFDPIEKELNKMGEKFLKNTPHLHKDWTMVKQYPLSKDLLALSHVWQSPDKKNLIIACKGAPEDILKLCHTDNKVRAEVLKEVSEMSNRGLRVLGGARAVFSNSELPKNQHDFDFEFLGLFGFIDPPRATAPEAVKEAHEAGMRVIMITGDYPGTAQFIANKIGIKNPESFITGDDLDRMTEPELREKIKTNNIFARVEPEQKLAIVNALKANGEIVAMTGDGVNDAPALKSAHIGIAMGERGTDVAREAASLVLLNDDFSSIVAAIRLGRRIYDNLKRAMGYILAIHVPIAGMAILPIIFGFPLVILPAHVAFLQLIIDPSCSTVFESEKEDAGIMHRPPRDLHKPMFSSRILVINLLQGLSILIATFGLFMMAVNSGRSDLEARSVGFASLVLANLLLIVMNLSWSKNFHQIILDANKTLLLVIISGLVCLGAVLYVPVLSGLFHLAPLQLVDLVRIVTVVSISLAWFEILKLVRPATISVK